MQEKIINYLKKEYNPDAIILHGSRARLMNRDSSDWDFILLYTNETSHKNGRKLFEGQNIEVSIFLLPIEDVVKTFSTKLQKAVVVFEVDDEGTDLLERAEAIYEKEIIWSQERINDHRLWFQGRIEGMKDMVNDPIVFNKYFSDIYPRIFNYWYWILRKENSQPIYVAVAEIKKKDPEYFELVKNFSDLDVSLNNKVIIIEKLRDKLFG